MYSDVPAKVEELVGKDGGHLSYHPSQYIECLWIYRIQSELVKALGKLGGKHGGKWGDDNSVATTVWRSCFIECQCEYKSRYTLNIIYSITKFPTLN